MSLERQSSETNPELGGVLEQKLVAFKVPEALWLYIFREGARQAYHDVLWDHIGDPGKDEGAAHPEIWTGEFHHLKHAYYTDTGKLIVVRQHVPKEPRDVSPKDFMITSTDMQTTKTTRLYAVGHAQATDVCWSPHYRRHSYVLSNDPGAGFTSVEHGLQEGFPHLVVDTPVRGNSSPGFVSTGDATEPLASSIMDIQTRAWQFGNYYRPEEIGRLAGLYVEVSAVPNVSEPVTMHG